MAPLPFAAAGQPPRRRRRSPRGPNPGAVPYLVRCVLALVLAVGAVVFSGKIAAAQNGAVHISVHRATGYSLGSQVRGTIELRAEGSGTLASVTYFIDGSELAVSATPPFAVRFSTNDYAPGWRTLRAEARTADGRVLHSNVLRIEVVPTRAAWATVRGIIVPGGMVLVAVFLVALVLSRVIGRRRPRRQAGQTDSADTASPVAPRSLSRPPEPDEELKRRIDDSRYIEL